MEMMYYDMYLSFSLKSNIEVNQYRVSMFEWRKETCYTDEDEFAKKFRISGF